MKRVTLHVDRLVLMGFRTKDRYALEDALGEELARQLSSPHAVRHLVSAADFSRLKVDEARVSSGPNPSVVGESPARNFAREFRS
jgi:hypothetical protein